MTRPEPVRADTYELQTHGILDDALHPRHDDLGIDTLGDEDDDVFDDDNDDDDDDDDADALSSSPSIPDEDIDFDFMYALHSFAATVEGQANATKGDMLVLLDDTNSYWWLVRIVKDHSVGYLPAETIETPQERLARLNKHRNIDLTAIMLEDHSPTSRSSSRKPFRRKGAKTVVFNSSCTYFQLEPINYDSSDVSDDEDDLEEYADGQMDDYDEPGAEADQAIDNTMQRRKADLAELDDLIDDVDAPHPSPRIGIESGDETDSAGRKIVRIMDFNNQAGERPTSAIFRDSKLEPLKISVTPSIARDRISISPVEDPEIFSSGKNKTDREKEDRKRSLSVSSSGYAESGADSDPREKDKKVRKNSVFGNLFKKKTKKSSKDEDVVREEEPVEIKVTAIAAPIQSEADRSGNSLDNEWNNPVRLRIDQKPEAMNNPPTIAVNEQYEKSKHTPTGAEISKELMFRPETPQRQPDIDSDNHASPATTNGSSSIATPSLPWSDASLHSFLDNDTSIRDVLVLIHEGGRLKKGSSVGSINPQIADLYSACAIHIEEMSSHLDDVLMSYLFNK